MAAALLILEHSKKLFCRIASRNNSSSNSCSNDNRHKCKCCRNGCNKHSWNDNRCDYIPRRSATRTISIAWTLDPKPQTAAPTPSQDSANVISVYSDAYTSIATNLNPGWGQATQTTEIQIDGNNTLEYASLNYQGLEYPQTDVSAMEYVHLDYYTDDATALDFFLISADPYLENAYSIPVVTGSWQSIDIPLSEYTVPELDKSSNSKPQEMERFGSTTSTSGKHLQPKEQILL